jgi:hypothetical protein
MTCAQGQALFLSKPDVIVLRTGPNRFDRYAGNSQACAMDEDVTPAFVRSKDIRS